MTGIEKILSGILSDSEAAAARIAEEAKQEAADIEKQGKADAAQFLTAGKQVADKKFETAKSNADSAAALKKRNISLECRSQLIEQVIDEAVKQIIALPDGEYFARLISLAKKYARGQKGVLRLSAADLKRDTDGFAKELAALDITLDSIPADINGGFILIYGDIEISAEPAALVREKKEELVDAVNRILFA